MTMHTFFSFIFKFNIPSYDISLEWTLKIKQRGVHYATGVSLAAKIPLSLSTDQLLTSSTNGCILQKIFHKNVLVRAIYL